MAVNRIWRVGTFGAGLVALGVLGGIGVSAAMQPQGTAPGTPSAKPAAATPPSPGAGPSAAPGAVGGVTPTMIMEMVQALKATPGCLSVELGQCASGKRVIFAFFKDKASVMTWYKSKEHLAAVDAVAPDRDKTKTPMAEVPDDGGPIMAVASISPGEGEKGMPKLAIELYSPLKAGLKLPGGGFAPDAFSELIKKK